jgi:LuxR family maltose regulon positive regulatory protein
MLVVQRAALALADNQPPQGLALLAAHRRREQPEMPPWVAVRRSVVEASLHLAVDDLDSAQRALDVAGDAVDPDLLSVRVHLFLARGDLQRARAVVDAWPDGDTPRSWRQRTLWTAVLEHRLGHAERARRLLADVAAAAELQHDLGVFREAGEHALGLARELYLAAPTAFLRAVVERPAGDGLSALTVKGLVEQLTEREFAVLAVLPTRLSNAEIAERFGISLNTIKTHLKHIYRKLGVEGRSEAVAAAGRLGLL